ncbi:MAG TPA: helicase-related protein, partial [Promineifilum sp.]|nr:helicase-related protein [Promineifilum sp.]
DIRASFNELWNGEDRDWLAIDLPDAVRDELIKRAPAHRPERDPLERPAPGAVRDGEGRPRLAVVTPIDRVLFQFVRDAPTLLNAGDLAAETSAVRPWPHQTQVARTLIGRFPDRALLCDEVGLGKTIEAGLIIRHLVLSGRVRRALILTPKAVLRQWQEELYEKFNLAIPRYEDGRLIGVYETSGPPIARPWDESDLLLATSHLARRRERVEELAAAPRWDLLVVDEAHHARRKDFLQPTYRPNRLLTLLNRLKAADRYDGLLLMTATPMQVHPVEVWDLLTVLGLSGRWGADERAFLDFFAELRRLPADTDWDLVYSLVNDYLSHVSLDGQIDPDFVRAMASELGAPRAEIIRTLPENLAPGRVVRALPPAAQQYAAELARRHTPLQRYLFRNTRTLLRRYVDKGLLKANVPTRRPQIRRVAFRADEAELYGRITEYISQFYARYESERRGLGFIMTVYRRRLTSSFYAVRRSLERRRDFLLRQIPASEAFTADDVTELDEEDALEQAGLDFEDLNAVDMTSPGMRAAFDAELTYLETFINDLRRLSGNDSKVDALKNELDRVFRQRPTALVFTQYTDTMDYLRDHLVTVYGSKIACYSGRGGEVWNGLTWVQTSKEWVKEQFHDGEIAILLCTESASEGLNLQTCGMLANYDMPWNPMRVEQRIGRIDRIGQTYPEVWISNYFYEDSIEDKVYRALEDRIQWFEDVVGALQPILAEVGEVTRKLAMLPAEEQAARFESEMRELRRKLEESKINALDIDRYVELDEPDPTVASPVRLADLEALLTTSAATGHLFTGHETIAGAWWLQWDRQQMAVTFRAELFDRWPQTLQFLSYGSPLLEAVLALVEPPDELPAGVARYEAADLPLRGWYDLSAGAPRPVGSLAELQRLAAAGQPAHAGDPEARAATAQAAFAAEAAARRDLNAQRRARLAGERQIVLAEQARQLVTQAALVEIALGRQKSLFDDEIYPSSFNEAAVGGLRRHKSPWSWIIYLLGQTGVPLPLPREDDPFFQQIAGEGVERLKDRFVRLTSETREVVAEWRAVQFSSHTPAAR